MVVRMTKWRPWPPLSSKKFDVKITVKQLQGIKELGCERLAVEIKWKGSKGNALSSLRRTVRRNFTKEESFREEGVVAWNEEFQSVCNLGAVKDGVFHPWEVVFTVISGSNRAENDRILLVSTSSLNLAEFGSTPGQDVEVSIPMSVSNPKFPSNASLLLSLRLEEAKTAQDASELVSRSVPCLPLSPLREVSSIDKGEVSLAKMGFSKVKFFKALSTRRTTKKVHGEEEVSDGKSSTKSDEAAYVYPLDSDSDEGEEAKDGKTDKIKKSLSYETLPYANHAGGLLYSSTSCSEDEDWIYHKHRKLETADLCYEDLPAAVSKSHQMTSPIAKILPWRRKKKGSLKSLSKGKEEPLLKRHYGDEGGDDIDNDRRLLCSSDESIFALQDVANQSSISEFGDDNFAVGSWEQKEIVSRDGHMMLKTSVFFASIDQRSERAAGEGACAALVTVIADWFLGNREHMPIKSQLDSLIREGSLDWRNLCENEKYLSLFPDRHFDLETVLQAKVRSLSVIPEKSFIGFFHPEGIEDGGFDFLQGAMSFDNIWDEISQATIPDHEPLIYIVSWNDHFFVLKVETDAFYIVDTLGERLFEGCNQAFILKFDRDTTIHKVETETQKSDDKVEVNVSDEEQTVVEIEEESNVVCQGKNSCKEYIKSFLAAIPLRELQVDLKKGLMASVPLHHRLQIEFHYTKFLQPVPISDSSEGIVDSTTECIPLEE